MDEKQRLRLIFMGTPIFAAIILKKILASPKFDVLALYCGPDRKVGRGLKITYCETKKLALENNVPVYQPVSLKDPEVAANMTSLTPDFLVVAAYGLLVPQDILAIPRWGAINIHASLLPAYRGAAPIQRAIMENFGENAQTGVSIMQMVRELDAGPVYARKSIPIGRNDRSSLERELASLGGSLLEDTLEKIAKENLQPEQQDENSVTWAPKLEKAHGIIDWNKNVAEVDALIRAVTPWPGGQTSFMLLGREGKMAITILPGKPGEKAQGLRPGEIIKTKNGLQIACADGWYIPGSIRPEGHREMAPADFANGYCKVKAGLCGLALKS